MSEKRDYYEVLGVSKESDEITIKKAYRKKAMEYHPDRYKGPKEEAEEKFKELNEAYSILSDPQQKSVYDRYGHQGLDPRMRASAHNSNPFDFFSSIFGMDFGDIFGGQRQRSRGPSRGRDALLEVSLSYEEAYEGISKKITIPFKQECKTCHGTGGKPGTSYKTCNNCHGSGVVEKRVQTGIFIQVSRDRCSKCRGRVKIPESKCKDCHGSGLSNKKEKISVRIPPGINNGEMVRVSGKGYPSSDGGTPGDLLLRANLQEHDYFQRDGLDVYMLLPVPFDVAALGGVIQAPVIGAPGEERTEELKIPKGTQVSDTLLIKGKGYIRDYSGRKVKGNMIYKVTIDVPTKLNKKQIKALKEFREASK